MVTEYHSVLSPIDGAVVTSFTPATSGQVVETLERARDAQLHWRKTSLYERLEICRRFVAIMSSRRDELGMEITLQMGRPMRYTPKEIDRMGDRALGMCALAEEALIDIPTTPEPGFLRFVRREPVGVVLAIVPWNYPYLTAVNCAIPALIAGNAVVLKPSPQTPLCGDRIAEALTEAGLPGNVFQVLHADAGRTDEAVRSPLVDFVSFTGSVAVGHAVKRAAAERFIGVALELGGKDPAYVRADADLPHTIENVVDGAFFNSGQSCCAVERAYVHKDVYDRFVEGAVDLTRQYILGDPRLDETTLGPMVSTKAASFVRNQISEAIAGGARALIDEGEFPASKPGTAYLAPQILVDVDHGMSVMREESFGPVVGMMRVESDEEAVRLMNDSPFGLTASVWTSDLDAATRLGEAVETGTWFMNRCDFLDPELAWTGVKDSGHGCSLSRIGFEQLTRPKSFHLKV